MKQFVLTLGLLLAGCGLVAAQETPPTTAAAPQRVRVDQNSVVTDAEGQRLPYQVWSGLVASGEFKLTPAPNYSPANPVFVVLPQSPEERAAQLARMPPPAESPFFKTGQAMAPFKVWDINGRKYDSKELLGKVVVLNFWFIGCPPCRREIPDLNRLVEQNAQRPDVVFLAVALDEKFAIQKFTKDNPFAYAHIPGARALAQRYGVRAFPTNVVLDKEGKVVFHALSHPNIAGFMQKAIDGVK
ncbi:TlpA family protein disulfide reductase [Hymenobacter latericus]|uniref:TlpA family protein disulfide reductase n=1 Tax=Hymenobacter sp. YIM 151858-1 TaxID=2987688 RepID=UPI002226F43F|nr:TlpA disulfide reductase family protein [Hymenobacter sp. YIM 151858-1]UYZ59677.1 TlpA family protein disulfide reductase [Hymenobacter sp. YIM 151858-1]